MGYITFFQYFYCDRMNFQTFFTVILLESGCFVPEVLKKLVQRVVLGMINISSG